MKDELVWTVSKKELEAAFELLLSVPARNGVVSSEYIQVNPFDGNTAVLYLSSDFSGCTFITGSKKYPFKKPFYLDRRLFDPFIGQGKESRIAEYTFRMTGSKLRVTHGVRQVVCNVSKDVSGYHAIPFYKDGKKMIIPEQLGVMLQAAVACSTNDPVTPNLNAVYVKPYEKGVKLYSSNTTIIFRARVRIKKPPTDAIAFPLSLAELVVEHEFPEVLWDSKSAMLTSPRGKLWSAVKSAARDSFPIEAIDREMAHCRDGKMLFSVDAESLSATASRINSYLSAVTREDLILNMILEKGSRKMKLRAGTGSTVFTEVVTLNKSATDDTSVAWPLEETLPVLISSKDHGEAKLYRRDDGVSFYTTKKLELVVAKLKVKGKKNG